MTDAEIAADYDARAEEYVALAGSIAQMDAADLALISAWCDGTQGRMLDAGCGPGHWTAFLHERGHEAIGVDLSTAFIAAGGAKHPQVPFVQATLRALPFEDADFAGILAWYSLIHTPPEELPEILAEFARVLRPGGSLLLGFFKGEARTPFDHAVTTAYFWDAGSLGELLADAGFDVRAADHRERGEYEVSRRPHGSVTAIRR